MLTLRAFSRAPFAHADHGPDRVGKIARYRDALGPRSSTRSPVGAGDRFCPPYDAEL